MPIDYEIRDFSLKIILLNKNSGLVVYLKHQKKPARWAGFLVRKRIFLIEKIHDSTVNLSAFNYCHLSKIKMISKPSITL